MPVKAPKIEKKIAILYANMNLAGSQCERKDASPEDVVHPAVTTKRHDRWLRYGTPFGRNCRYGDAKTVSRKALAAGN